MDLIYLTLNFVFMKNTFILLVMLVLMISSCEEEEPQACSPAETGVSGTVRDSNNDALEGVTLTMQGATQTSTTTGTDGAFRITGLPSGDYRLIAQKSGFEDNLIEISVRDCIIEVVDVSLVLSSNGLSIGVFPNNINFNQGEFQKTTTITNNATSDVLFNATTDQSWLSIAQENGVLPAGQSMSLAISINRDIVANGSGTITISTPSNGSQTIYVTVQ